MLRWVVSGGVGRAVSHCAKKSGGLLLEDGPGARGAELLYLRARRRGRHARKPSRVQASRVVMALSTGMRPMSRGAIRLTDPNPSDPLKIQANYLADPQDLKDLMIGIGQAREIGNAAALQPYAKREAAPRNLNNADLERFIRNGLTTFWHQSGTAKMGRDALSVVDGRLKVHGLDGLRVADASAMPRVTTGNTMAPCIGALGRHRRTGRCHPARRAHASPLRAGWIAPSVLRAPIGWPTPRRATTL